MIPPESLLEGSVRSLQFQTGSGNLWPAINIWKLMEQFGAPGAERTLCLWLEQGCSVMNKARNEQRNGQVMVRGASRSRMWQSEEIHFACDFFAGREVRSLLFSEMPFFLLHFAKWRIILHACVLEIQHLFWSMKFLIWTPKRENLLLLSWFWWKCVNLSIFNLSGKTPFSIVFKFFVVETNTSIYCCWL